MMSERHRTLVLTMLVGPTPGACFALPKHTLILGRDADCDIAIDDRRVSRHHARIEPEDDGRLLLVDNGSSNGTTVNGEAVSRQHVQVGDTIGLGEEIVLLLDLRDTQSLVLDAFATLGALGRFTDRLRSRIEPLPKTPLADISGEVGTFAELDLGTLLADVEHTMRPLLHDGVTLATHALPEPFTLEAEASALLRALLAIVCNANDAVGPTGSIVVRATLEEQAGPTPGVPAGPVLRIEVCDDGPGLLGITALEALAPLTTTRIGRDGLGLPAAWGVARAHQGRLELRSSTRGCRVAIVLPV